MLTRMCMTQKLLRVLAIPMLICTYFLLRIFLLTKKNLAQLNYKVSNNRHMADLVNRCTGS